MENTALLRASYIKPWLYSVANEKVDVDNGFLLCPNHDSLFDGGFISFDNNGGILISDRLTQIDRIFLNVTTDMHMELSDGNRIYMEYHRNNIFK